MVKQALLIAALVLALRLPFLHQAIQGDDLYYLYGAEHAQIDPLHPTHAHYVFRGDMVDMRGQSHPPLNSWILGALLAAFGDVKEVPFHLFYIVFSLIAALAMLALARRFSDRPLLATLLFCAVPAFVVNGNSLEADLPFLAFWMTAMALFVYAVDRDSMPALAGSALAAGLAALDAYQGVFLTPILALYVFQQRRKMVARIYRLACGARHSRRMADLGASDQRSDARRRARRLYAVVSFCGARAERAAEPRRWWCIWLGWCRP